MEFYKTMPWKPKMAIFFQVCIFITCRCSWLAPAHVCILSHIQVRQFFMYWNSCSLFFFLTAYIVKLLECSRSALYFLRCSWCFVFAPCTRHMLKIIDNGEFYEQEKPLSLNDLKSLVLILKQVEYCNTIATLCCHEAFTCCVEYTIFWNIIVVANLHNLCCSVILVTFDLHMLHCTFCVVGVNWIMH